MNSISPTQNIVLKSFHLFSTVLLDHLYGDTGALNDKLCTSLANDMYKQGKTQKSNHGRILSAQDTLIKYVRSTIQNSEFGSELDRNFILKCIAHDTYRYESFLFGLVYRVVRDSTQKSDWSYRKIVDTFGKYVLAIAQLLDQDIMKFEGEAIKIMIHDSEEVARYSLLKFAEEQEKKNASQPA